MNSKHISLHLTCASFVYFCCLLDAFRKPLRHKNETTGCVLAALFQNCSCDCVNSHNYCSNILLVVNDFVQVVPANLFSGGALWPILGCATSVLRFWFREVRSVQSQFSQIVLTNHLCCTNFDTPACCTTRLCVAQLDRVSRKTHVGTLEGLGLSLEHQ
jgi:hypothetical protein